MIPYQHTGDCSPVHAYCPLAPAEAKTRGLYPGLPAPSQLRHTRPSPYRLCSSPASQSLSEDKDLKAFVPHFQYGIGLVCLLPPGPRRARTRGLCSGACNPWIQACLGLPSLCPSLSTWASLRPESRPGSHESQFTYRLAFCG
jgi:hypothetical protein